MKQIAEETLKLSKVESYLSSSSANTNVKYPVIIKELPEVIVASMSTITPTSAALLPLQHMCQGGLCRSQQHPK